MEVDEGRGLAFQSHHSPLSNMYSCHVVYDGHHFEAIVIAYQYARAKICGYRREAEIIAHTTCAYKAKVYTKDFNDTKEWISCRIKLMTELVRYKFSHNEDCKQWVLESGKKKLKEATTDKFWATGLVLSRARDIKEGKILGQNKLGEI